MIAHKGQKRPTAWEQMRIDAAMKGGCYLSRIRQHMGLAVPMGKFECHHITRGGKRLGHLYTVPLHEWYHRGVVPTDCRNKKEARRRYGASLADGSKAFKASHLLDEIELWQSLQRAMCMDDTPPASKIFKRESLLPEAERVGSLEQQ